MKKSFILYNDALSVLDELTDEQAGQLFKAIRSHQLGLVTELDFGLKMAFLPFKNQFDRDEDKYQETVERNKINGSKGGRPKKPTQTQKTQVVNPKPKKPYNDNDSGNDNEKDNKNKGEHLFKNSPFFDKRVFHTAIIKTDFEVKNIDYKHYYDRLVDWSESGGNKKKDWIATIRGWIRKDIKEEKLFTKIPEKAIVPHWNETERGFNK